VTLVTTRELLELRNIIRESLGAAWIVSKYRVLPSFSHLTANLDASYAVTIQKYMNSILTIKQHNTTNTMYQLILHKKITHVSPSTVTLLTITEVMNILKPETTLIKFKLAHN
jgi:hypothetical protein